ncbi:MAG: alpha/beta hydrolase [Polyangiaceae bacterium]
MDFLSPSAIPPPITPPFERESFVPGVDGTRLYVRAYDRPEHGDGPNVRGFFTDGIGCDGFIWKRSWERIAESLSLTHWNYRGHGRSAPPTDADRLSIEDCAEDLERVIRAEPEQPNVLFGHSMGVQVALEHYRKYPGSTRALVLICGSYGKVTHTVRGMPILEYILPSLTRFVEKYPEVVRAVWPRIPHETALRMALKLGDLDPDNARIEDIVPYMTHMASVDIAMFLRMLKFAGEHTAESYLEEVHVPTLVIAGERDTFTPAWLSTSMAHRIPDAELLMVPGGSHAAPLEQPDLVHDAIMKFLRDRVGIGKS